MKSTLKMVSNGEKDENIENVLTYKNIFIACKHVFDDSIKI